VWPFIATALHYSGTKGPCFFLVRALRTTEFGQMVALLKKAASRSKKIEKALKEYQPLFQAVSNEGPAPPIWRLPRGLQAPSMRGRTREKS
jgi:hypothetical protein